MLDPQKMRFRAQVWEGDNMLATNTLDTNTKALHWGRRIMEAYQRRIENYNRQEDFSVVICEVSFTPKTILHHDGSISILCALCDMWCSEDHKIRECIPCNGMFCSEKHQCETECSRNYKEFHNGEAIGGAQCYCGSTVQFYSTQQAERWEELHANCADSLKDADGNLPWANNWKGEKKNDR